jgi:hypothetical protein
MRSNLGGDIPVHTRRVWEAPAIIELPIGTETRFAAANSAPFSAGERIEPPAPVAPSSKLGFAFEMSFPLSARTD